MDIIDNLMYASYASDVQRSIGMLPPPGAPVNVPIVRPANRITSDYIDSFPSLPVPVAPPHNYALGDKMNFCAYEDPGSIEAAVYRHWYDVDGQFNYDSGGLVLHGGATNGVRLVSFEISSTYHLIYSYLLENTRLLQIFERLLEKYLTDEEFGIAANNQVVSWIYNAERLFFKSDTQISSNIRSLIRPSSDLTRRNAYWRMFGMDLAFGDINSQTSSLAYYKAKTSNLQFIPLFEKYLAEIWQGYINARNSSGENRADVNVVVDLAIQLRELLIARRGDVAGNTYANLNLSREEFSSILITSWFTFILSDNTPVVEFLNCQSSTIGERLLKIGTKVGVPAHSKCQYLFEMAGAAANILTSIEVGGFLDNAGNMQTVLSSLNPPPAIPPAQVFINFMTDFLTVINNWEKATGHKIKNPEANITGTVRVQQNGVKMKPALN
jgi:hypothetical protein